MYSKAYLDAAGSLVYSPAYLVTRFTPPSIVEEPHLYQIDLQREKYGEPYYIIGYILVNRVAAFDVAS